MTCCILYDISFCHQKLFSFSNLAEKCGEKHCQQLHYYLIGSYLYIVFCLWLEFSKFSLNESLKCLWAICCFTVNNLSSFSLFCYELKANELLSRYTHVRLLWSKDRGFEPQLVIVCKGPRFSNFSKFEFIC